MADERLDVTSERFDAEASLAQPEARNVSLPYPDVAELRSLVQCSQLVPASVRAEVEGAYGAPSAPKNEEEKARTAAKKAFMIQRTAQYMASVDQAAAVDPIQTIVQRVRKGPLMLLRRAYQGARKVDVVTRHARGVKGVLRAEVHGFDKFMNLLLADVEEWFAHRTEVLRIKPKPAAAGAAPGGAAQTPCAAAAEPLKTDSDAQRGSVAEDAREGEADVARGSSGGEAAAAAPERTQTRRGWRQVLRKRKLARVLLRGDQVVTVAFADGPMRLPASLRHLQPLQPAAPD